MIKTKKVFTDPDFEILKLYVADVITTSESVGDGDDWWLPEI